METSDIIIIAIVIVAMFVMVIVVMRMLGSITKTLDEKINQEFKDLGVKS